MTPQRKFQHSSFVLAILDNPWNQTSKSLFMSSIDKTIPVSIVLEKNCTHCNKVFTTMQGLHTHIGKMHTAQDHKKLSCELCGKLFRTRTLKVRNRQFSITWFRLGVDLPEKLFYEKVLFFTQLSYHLMYKLLKKSYMLSSAYTPWALST